MHESEKWKWSHSVMFKPSATPWTAAFQAPPSMGFSRQERWSGVSLPSPLREMGIPENLTCLLRNLYVGQEATVRIPYGTTDWFKIEKGVQQGWLLSPCLFNLYAEYIMRNARLDESNPKHQQPQKCRWYHSNGRKWGGTKELLDEGEGGEWKSWLRTKYF